MLKKIISWPFRSLPTFGLSLVMIVGGGYWVYTINQERHFNQPVVLESIKLLGKQAKIKQVLGFPLSYSFQISNRYAQLEDGHYFNFQVTGPKCKATVEMIAQQQPAKQIYEYDNPLQNIQSIKSEISGVLKHLDQLNTSILKQKDRKKKQELIIQKQKESKQLEKFNNLLIEKQYLTVEKKLKFFIPQKDVYLTILSKQAAGSEQTYGKEQKLWGIKSLVMTIPNRTKMKVHPKPEKTFEQKKQIVKSKTLPSTPTYGYFHKLIDIDISELTKEEIEEYSKQKIKFMYTKYNAFRVASGIILLGAVYALFRYKDNWLIRSIKGSILENEVKLKIRNHPKVVELLESKKKEPHFDSLIGGGMSGQYFDCTIGMYGLTNGKVHFKGKYEPDLNYYKFQMLMLCYRQKQKKIEIDLLK